MSEIEKMMQNANIKQNRMCEWTCKDNDFCNAKCEHYESTQLYYPPFTAEKQIELIKFILGKGVYYDTDKDYKEFWFHYTDDIENADYKPFEEAVCEFINVAWQDLTEEEKQQVKGILE